MQVKRLCKEALPSWIMSMAAIWRGWRERGTCESLTLEVEDWLSILCSMLPAGVTTRVPKGRPPDDDEQTKNQSIPSIDV